jgi:dienelactone hydrolase
MTKTVFSEISVPSGYQGLPIKIRISKTTELSKTVLVLHPGAFEFLGGDKNRYTKILLWLRLHLSSHPTVITYETSRQSISPPLISTTDPLYWKKKELYWKKLFDGKTFSMELDDVRNVYKYIRNTLRPESIYVLGFSVGGTIAMILSSEISTINKLCVVGSAISTKRPHLPVLTGYPTKEWILKRVASYSHDIKIMQGRRDTVVSLDDAEEVFHALRSPAHASFERFARADHMFSGNNHYYLFHAQRLLQQFRIFFDTTFDNP